MPGIYDNDKQEYMFDDHYWNGQWLLDREGNLYINPESGVVAEIIGPDNEIMAALNAACRANDGGDVPDDVIAELDLIEIGPHDRRFSVLWGYFLAQ